MTNSEFFAWLKSKQSNGKLTQTQVDSANLLLDIETPDVLQVILAGINGWSISNIMTSKKLTKADIVAAAKEFGIEPAALKAVIDVEASGEGFDSMGRPKILFEPHVFWDQLEQIKYFTKRAQLQKSHPGILSPTWDKSLYKVGGSSYDKLAIAAELNWDAAHKSASWGLGQVMGRNAEKIGYASIKEFVADMYESEAKQLKAMGRFLKANNLISKIQRHDWAGFALRYNGRSYAENKYDVKLAAAYALAKRQGW